MPLTFMPPEDCFAEHEDVSFDIRALEAVIDRFFADIHDVMDRHHLDLCAVHTAFARLLLDRCIANGHAGCAVHAAKDVIERAQAMVEAEQEAQADWRRH